VQPGPLEHDRRFVADHPAVVPGRDVDDFERGDLVPSPVFEPDSGPAGQQHADMTCLAPLPAHSRAYMLGPAPAWLVDDVPDREVPELDELCPQQWKLDRLVRRGEPLQAQVDHPRST
jgi:hypothetical protein